jgi:hypothetical protein
VPEPVPGGFAFGFARYEVSPAHAALSIIDHDGTQRLDVSIGFGGVRAMTYVPSRNQLCIAWRDNSNVYWAWLALDGTKRSSDHLLYTATPTERDSRIGCDGDGARAVIEDFSAADVALFYLSVNADGSVRRPRTLTSMGSMPTLLEATLSHAPTKSLIYRYGSASSATLVADLDADVPSIGVPVELPFSVQAARRWWTVDRYALTYMDYSNSVSKAMYATLAPDFTIATQPMHVAAVADAGGLDIFITGYARSPAGHTLLALERADTLTSQDGFLVFLAPR